MTLKYLYSKLIKKLQIPAIKNCNIDKKSKICSCSQVVNCIINKYSYIGDYCCVIDCDIGAFCSIASNCIIGGASHPIDWVSTSPVFYEGKNILNKNFSNRKFNPYVKTTIGNDVWIGNNCLIKGGLKIGDGVILGMGSVLTKDIPPYEIWAGNPAKLIRKRFDDQTIEKLLELKWWEKLDSDLIKVSNNFNDIEKYLNTNMEKSK